MPLISFLTQEVRPNDIPSVDHLNSQIPDACKPDIGKIINTLIDAGVSCCDACIFVESNLQVLLKGGDAADKLVSDYIYSYSPFPTLPLKGTSSMPTFKLTKSTKGSPKSFSPKKAKAGDPVPTDFLIDNQDQSFSVSGVDSQGFPVDISSLYTLSVVSSDATVFSVDPVTSMTVQGHALKPGSTSLAFTATANDGVSATLGFDLPISVSTGPAGNLVVVPGQPTPRVP